MDLKSIVTVDNVKKAYEYMGYAFFENGDYNLNLFGIRNMDKDPNTFNDVVGLLYKVNGKWTLKKYDATTDPGLYWRENLMNPEGTAIIIPGQYRGVYGIGLHKNSYEALRQKKPMKYWRDRNKDKKLDFGGKVYEEIAYTNIHRATKILGEKSLYVNSHSGGCLVIAARNDFDEFMSICKKARELYGNSFTLTLFTEKQFRCESKALY